MRLGPTSRVPRWLAGLTAAALLAMGLLTAPALVPLATTTIAKASAACPDAEVDFARGREEAPGVGAVGQGFINSLQRKGPPKTIGAYGVNYPADVSVTKGSNDMSAHVQSMAATCPNTKLVLGGYSLGAAGARRRGRDDPAGFRLHRSATAADGSARRRGRAVRQRRPTSGRRYPRSQPGLRRQDHRPVCSERPDLHRRCPGPALALPPAAVLHRLGPGGSGGRLRGRQAVDQSRERRSRVISVRAC